VNERFVASGPHCCVVEPGESFALEESIRGGKTENDFWDLRFRLWRAVNEPTTCLAPTTEGYSKDVVRWVGLRLPGYERVGNRKEVISKAVVVCW